MKKLLYIVPLAAVLLLAACRPGDRTATTGDDLSDQVSFILGHQLGEGISMQVEDLEEQETRLDRESILEGFRAGLRGDTLAYSQAEVDSLMRTFELGVRERAVAHQERAAAENRADGEAFIAEYEQQDDVVTTDSGLRYRVIEEGTGEPPAARDRVLVHYEGRFPDGEVFDSSRERGEPTGFRVDGLVPGFTEALQLMRPGARFEIVLPPELGYGQQAPPTIGPGRTLIFDLELLEVERR